MGTSTRVCGEQEKNATAQQLVNESARGVEAGAMDLVNDLVAHYPGLSVPTAAAAVSSALITVGLRIAAATLGIPAHVKGSRFDARLRDLRAQLMDGLEQLHKEVIDDPREAVEALRTRR